MVFDTYAGNQSWVRDGIFSGKSWGSGSKNLEKNLEEIPKSQGSRFIFSGAKALKYPTASKKALLHPQSETMLIFIPRIRDFVPSGSGFFRGMGSPVKKPSLPVKLEN